MDTTFLIKIITIKSKTYKNTKKNIYFLHNIINDNIKIIPVCVLLCAFKCELFV